MKDDTTEIAETTQDIFAEAESFDDDKSSLMGGLPPEEQEDTEDETTTENEDVAQPDDEIEDESSEEENTEPEEEAKKGEAAEEGEDPEEPAKAEAIPESVSAQLKEAFPNKDFKTPEEVTEAMQTLVKNSNDLQAERKNNERIINLFSNSEEMVDMARKMDGGQSFMEALAGTVDIPAALEEMKEEDPEQYKKMLKAQARREAKMEREEEERKEREKQFVDNQEDSKANIAAFQKEHGMDDKQKEELLDTVGGHFTDIVNGHITPSFLQLMNRGINYENDLEKKFEEGRIKGRNEKITKERSKKKGDNLPTIRGGGKPKGNEPTKEHDIFDDAFSPQVPISEIK